MIVDAPRPLFEHLEELRRRLFVMLGAVAVASLAGYVWARPILEWLTRPVGHLVFLTPLEAFTSHLKVAVIAGAVLASPVVAYELWKFAAPGLGPREQRWAAMAALAAGGLFAVGGFVALRCVMPVALRFLLSFSSESLQPMISIGSYLTLVIMLTLIFGLAFELPLVTVILAKAGLVSPSQLAGNRRFVILGIFILAAALTPGPDVISQVSLAIPLVVLYEISIWLVRVVG
ncbi:MAG: twin-arginine translocase subunit TatC [Candidatus Omnitrophica bacterium]|nr:twin-arginine translocase subunit TatC [Candidatus Omnitrophota bacterium]